MPGSINIDDLRLEQFHPEMAPALASAFAASEGELWTWMPSAASEQEDADAFIIRCSRAFDEGMTFAYGIVVAGDLVGYCNLTPHGDWAEIGYWIRSNATGAGLGTLAVRTLVDAAFEYVPDLIRVEAHCDKANRASRRVAEKAGLREVRTRRRNARTESESGTELVFAIERPPATRRWLHHASPS